MGWYYNYHLGLMDKKTKKIYPLGPFTYKGEYREVLSLCKYSALSDEYDHLFTELKFEDFSEEFIKAIDPKGEWFNKEEYGKYGTVFSYIPYNDLPKGELVKRGYCLLDDIERYEKSHNPEFYNILSPTAYAKKLKNAIDFGKYSKTVQDVYEDVQKTIEHSEDEDDEEDYYDDAEKDWEKEEREWEEYIDSCENYAYYSWIDWESVEAECFELRQAMNLFLDFGDYSDKDMEPIILMHIS